MSVCGGGEHGREREKRLIIKYSKIQQLALPNEGMGGERSQLLPLAWKEALDESLGVCELNVTAITRSQRLWSRTAWLSALP